MIPEQIRHTCSLVILAGGKSSRMGRPKAWLPFHGRPMLARVLDRLSTLFEDVVVVRASGQELPDVEARFVEDEEPGLGPVAGLAVGLAAVARPLAFATSCDAPFIDPRVVAHLVARCEPPYAVVVPLWEGRPQPLHAVYRADNAPILRQLLAAGRRRPVNLFAEVPTLEVPEEEIRALDPDGLTFMNTNTPEDWERALALANELEPPSTPNAPQGLAPTTRVRRRLPTTWADPTPNAQRLTPNATVPITVELLGLARLTARQETVELRVPPHGPLSAIVAALADAVPALVGTAIEPEGHRLTRGFRLFHNGREPLRDEDPSLAPGDNLLLLSAEVGG